MLTRDLIEEILTSIGLESIERDVREKEVHPDGKEKTREESEGRRFGK